MGRVSRLMLHGFQAGDYTIYSVNDRARPPTTLGCAATWWCSLGLRAVATDTTRSWRIRRAAVDLNLRPLPPEVNLCLPSKTNLAARLDLRFRLTLVIFR